jgi:trigger factor
MPQDHPLKAMRGRELSFSIRITEVKKARLPQLNDEFAKDYGKDDLEGLKEHIRKELERSQHHSIQRLQKAQIVKTLLERHDFEVPQSLLQQELQRLVGEALARGEGQEPEALKEAFREQALRNVKASVLLQLIAEAEGLSVSEEELKGRIQETAQRAGLGMEDVIKYYTARDGSLEGLRQAALEEKTLQWLLQRARKKTPKEDKE